MLKITNTNIDTLKELGESIFISCQCLEENCLCNYTSGNVFYCCTFSKDEYKDMLAYLFSQPYTEKNAMIAYRYSIKYMIYLNMYPKIKKTLYSNMNKVIKMVENLTYQAEMTLLMENAFNVFCCTHHTLKGKRCRKRVKGVTKCFIHTKLLKTIVVVLNMYILSDISPLVIDYI